MAGLAAMECAVGVDGNEIYVGREVHSAFFVVKVSIYGVLQLGCLGVIEIRLCILVYSFHYVCHCTQFLIHQHVQVNRCGASVGTEEYVGVIVDADGGIVKEIVEARGLVAAGATVPSHKGFKLIQLIGDPRGIVIRLLQDKCEVLGKAGLVGVFTFLYEGVFALAVDHNGHFAVFFDVVEKIEDTALFTLEKFGLSCAVVVRNDLADGDVGEPAIPVPELVFIDRAGDDKGVFQALHRLASQLEI